MKQSIQASLTYLEAFVYGSLKGPSTYIHTKFTDSNYVLGVGST